MPELSLPRKVLAVHDALDAAGLEHAFGGALALAYYAEPRATKDIDVNVFVDLPERPRLLAVMAALPAPGTGRADADRDGWEQFELDGTLVDVVYAYDTFHLAMQAAAVRHPFLGQPLPFLCAEHLVACKAIFDRPKDWLDIDQVLFAEEVFDAAECLRWVEHVVGPDDARLARLRAAIERFR